MIRYMRLTKYVYLRGKYSRTYVDLEPRRMTEINSILAADDGSAKEYSRDEWRQYMGVYGSYVLPFETVEKLREILSNVDAEIAAIERKLGVSETVSKPVETRDELKEEIAARRIYRTSLQNLEIKVDFHNDVAKIDETINALADLRDHNKSKFAKKFSIEPKGSSILPLISLTTAC